MLLFYIGTDHLYDTNEAGTILNIEHLDQTRVIMNNRRLVTHIIPESNTDDDSFHNAEKWGTLSSVEKSCFSIKKSGEPIFSFNVEDSNIEVDNAKSFICVIPAACLSKTSCNLEVNDLSQDIPSFYARREAKFFNLSFVIPAGTKEITLKAEGSPNTQFVIKDIQIWQ